MFRVGGSSSPTPLPKQGRLQQAAKDLVQAGLEYLQRMRIHNLPGQPVHSTNMQSTFAKPHIRNYHGRMDSKFIGVLIFS